MGVYLIDAKDFRKEQTANKGNLCIARFESTTGEPLYYSCPRPNDSEKKSYCCYLDKCCDYKEFQKQTESNFKKTQNYPALAKGAFGSALKFLLWTVVIVIVLILGCCCLTFWLCKKRKLFQGSVFNTPLPNQPPGPSPYVRPANPYTAYQWPPDTSGGVPIPQATNGGVAPPPPAYPNPSYPPMPMPGNGASRGSQPPFNPNFK